MAQLPLVTIIIPTYHDWERLYICLEALKNQTYPAGLFEVIVINNDPNDLMPAQYKLQENFRLLSEGKPGSYAARNKGILEATGEILGFTDSDCVPHADWIENAVKKFSNDNVDRVAGNIELIYKDHTKRTWVELYESIYEFDQKRIVSVHKASVTANLFVRKELFQKVGLFDLTKMSGEDFGWNRRANLHNFNIIYGEDVKISHPSRSTFSEFVSKKRREFGGKKTARSKGFKQLVKNVFYLPFLFYTIVLRKNYNLFFRERRLSLIDKAKVTVVNIYSYFVFASEFFKLIFGGQRAR